MAEQTSTPRKLYKSRKDKMVDGICGGIAEYFQIDPTVVRVIWFFTFFLNGLGLAAYIISAILIPPNPDHQNLKEEEIRKHNPQILWGILLILAGIAFLFNSWHHFHFFWHWPFHFWSWEWWELPWAVIGPALLIGFGIFYIIHVLRQDMNSDSVPKKAGQTKEKTLIRPLKNRMVAGVCAAFADYFKIDPTWIRIGCVLFAIITRGAPLIILYIVLIFIIPREQEP